MTSSIFYSIIISVKNLRKSLLLMTLFFLENHAVEPVEKSDKELFVTIINSPLDANNLLEAREKDGEIEIIVPENSKAIICLPVFCPPMEIGNLKFLLPTHYRDESNKEEPLSKLIKITGNGFDALKVNALQTNAPVKALHLGKMECNSLCPNTLSLLEQFMLDHMPFATAFNLIKQCNASRLRSLCLGKLPEPSKQNQVTYITLILTQPYSELRHLNLFFINLDFINLKLSNENFPLLTKLAINKCENKNIFNSLQELDSLKTLYLLMNTIETVSISNLPKNLKELKVIEDKYIKFEINRVHSLKTLVTYIDKLEIIKIVKSKNTFFPTLKELKITNIQEKKAVVYNLDK
jgi:hypothetical protein